MRRVSFSLSLLCLLVSVGRAAGASIEVPTTDSFTWDNGEAKPFELTWDGSQARFTVGGLGTSTYGSWLDCCADTFDRVRVVHPGATLTFTDLAINTLPVNTVFVDDLDLTLLKRGALDNLGLLTGVVTMNWDDPFSRMARLSFDAAPSQIVGSEMAPSGDFQPESSVTSVPEPATLLLVGGGLVGAAVAARRRRDGARR